MFGPEKPTSKAETDPEALAQSLELELIMKRASWQKARARRGTWRLLSFLFLFLVLLGAIFAYFYFATAMQKRGEGPPAASAEQNR